MFNVNQNVQIRGQRIFILKPSCKRGELPTITVEEIKNENSDPIKKIFTRVTMKSAIALVNYLCKEGITQHKGFIPL